MNSAKQISIIVFLLSIIALSACVPVQEFVQKIEGSNEDDDMIRGSGDIITEERNISGFDRLSVSGSGTLYLTQGNSESLTITTDENLLQYLDSKVEGSTLSIGRSRDAQNLDLRPSDNIIYRLTARDLESIVLSGATNVDSESLQVDDLHMNISGASKISIDELILDHLTAVFSGASRIDLAGSAKEVDIDVSGASDLDTKNLEVDEVSLVVSGASDARVRANHSLDLICSGASTVKYYGDPQVSVQSSGTSTCQHAGD